ncbi:MAG TPA: hypothetical protein VMH90_00160 [Thermoplasmata archaeon]|nr:hypothetical protein [Thermoplasmata archaeon]
MRLPGLPVSLAEYPSECVTNARFRGHSLDALDRIFLPRTLEGLLPGPPERVREFIEDDNRGAILPEPVASLDGMPFYLSVKGIGSTVDPFSDGPLDRHLAAQLTEDPSVRRHLLGAPTGGIDRFITGELWLRGSPYGGQGLDHARAALRISERADLTDLAGFRIAPVVKVAILPAALQEQLRGIHWYRGYRGAFVQELRLVPSNVRIYFHSRTTVGENARELFDRFHVDSAAAARRFEVRFVRSAVAMLTLFARSLERGPGEGGYRGLDFHDVWLDKDAVIAPDGTAYFVDLEGIEAVEVEGTRVAERIEDQIYRSLYEFMFAYEQIDRERGRRFGDPAGRRERFESIVVDALHDDPFARPVIEGRSVGMEVRNPLGEESLYTRFPLVDR